MPRFSWSRHIRALRLTGLRAAYRCTPSAAGSIGASVRIRPTASGATSSELQTSRMGSAVPVRPIELRTCALFRIPTSAARSRAAALENEHVRAAVSLWRLYFETSLAWPSSGRWYDGKRATAGTHGSQLPDGLKAILTPATGTAHITAVPGSETD